MISISQTLKELRFLTIASAIEAGTPAAKLQIYTGTRPSNNGAVTAGNVLVATVLIPDPAFKSRTGTTAVINTEAESSVLADGTPTWARIVSGSGNTLIDMDIGAGLDLQLNSPTFYAGGKLTVVSLTIVE